MRGETFLEALALAEEPDDQLRALVGVALTQAYSGLRAISADGADREPHEVSYDATLALLTQTTTPEAIDRAAAAAFAALQVWGSQRNDPFVRSLVYAALLQYGNALLDASTPALARQVLMCVSVDAELDGQWELSAQARLFTGFAWRMTGHWDASAAAYRRARELALGAGDLFTAIRAQIGEANNQRSRGDLPGAAATLTRLLTRAKRVCPEVVPRVLLAFATLENSRGAYELALTLAHQALAAAAADDEARGAALVDIAHFLADFGAFDVARDALRAVIRGSPPARVRLNAELNLLSLAARHADAADVDHFRATLRTASLTVPQRAMYHLSAAQGLRATGRAALARAECERAIETARAHSLFQIMFAGEAELNALDAASDVPVASVAAQQHLRSSERVEAVAQDVRRMLASGPVLVG